MVAKIDKILFYLCGHMNKAVLRLEIVTISLLRELYAHELMRCIWYRYIEDSTLWLQELRAFKAKHKDFLLALLRRRGKSPGWQSYFYQCIGQCLGWLSRYLPQKQALRLLQWLEKRSLQRYQKAFRMLNRYAAIRTMVAALIQQPLPHKEPADDIFNYLQTFLEDQQQLLHRFYA